MAMSTAEWFAKKMGAPAPVGGVVMRPPEPIQYQQPQPVPALYPQHQPQQYVAPPQQEVQPGYQQVLDPNRPAHAEIDMGTAMRLWKGGPAHRKEGHLACPECGSTTGYTQYTGANGTTIVNSNSGITGSIRPHCFECGYNGGFKQGDQANWV